MLCFLVGYAAMHKVPDAEDVIVSAICLIRWLQGVLGHTLTPVRQLFERIAAPSAAEDAETRFQHFKKHVWLRIKESGSSGSAHHPA